MIENLTEWLTPARVENIVIALTSAVIGTAGGAYAGAWAAQRIGKKAAEREATEQQMRDINAAIQLAYSVANPCINMKEQFVLPLLGHYEAQHATVHHYHSLMLQGRLSPSTGVHLGSFAFRTFEPQRPPVSRLENVVLEKLRPRGRVQTLAVVLTQVLASLNTTVSEYNQLAREFRDQDIERPEVIARIFAIPSDRGDVDQRFRDTVRLLGELTDNCIFFSYLICMDLQEQGNELRQQHPKIFRGAARRVVRIDFSPAIHKGLVPSIDDYPDWKAGFVRSVQFTKGRRLAQGWWKVRHGWRRWHRSLGWRPRGIAPWRRY